MGFHLGVVCLLTMGYAGSTNSNPGFQNCGFNLMATCDDIMWLYADRDLLVKNSSDWRITSKVYIPANTKVIEIHCLDNWIVGGILAASDNGFMTDEKWNCSSDNGRTWHSAFSLGKNGRTAPDISKDAKWIWTDMKHWEQTDYRRHTKAICKIELETSHCQCPPFQKLSSTPTTTISTPMPTRRPILSKPKTDFTLSATCDEKMQLFADGKPLAATNSWKDTSQVKIPASTYTIEIHCMDKGGVGGILASSDNGLKTDGTWNCSSNNGSTWNRAYQVGPNKGGVTAISPEAEWIWFTQPGGCIDWTSKYTGDLLKRNIICKINLDPIDGEWSTWSEFNSCSSTCGKATKSRTRKCNNPPPRNGGKDCHGLEEETVSCGLSPCGSDIGCPYSDVYMDCSKWKKECKKGPWKVCMNEYRKKTCKCTNDDKCLTSLGYPENYPNNYDSNQTLSVTPGQNIEITFHHFDVERDNKCEYDYLEFFDKNGNTASQKLCGDALPQKLTISTSTAFAVFHSDRSDTEKGYKFCYKSGADDCQNGNGEDYSGTMSRTVSGLTCQKWTSQIPHKHKHGNLGDHNYCRNPDDETGVWCYTTDSGTKFEYCNVPVCDYPQCEGGAEYCEATDPSISSCCSSQTRTTCGQNSETCKQSQHTKSCVGNKNNRTRIYNYKTGEMTVLNNPTNDEIKTHMSKVINAKIVSITYTKTELIRCLKHTGICKWNHHAFNVIETDVTGTFISLDKESDGFYIQIGDEQQVSEELEGKQRKPFIESKNYPGDEKMIGAVIDFVITKNINGRYILPTKNCQTSSETILAKFKGIF